MSDLVSTLYEPALFDVRREVANDPTIARLLDPNIPAAQLERFLIEYCAQGVQITEPVDGWIRRAGERCKELGLVETGSSLIKHAVHEAGHHLMFMEDTRHLVKRWNQRQANQLNADQLLAQSATPAMRDYINLHEDVIASDAPFGQVAIEYEIERLSVDLLPALMKSFEQKLGPSIMQGLSFLSEHAAIDVGHTHLNRKMMERLLKARPSAAGSLAQAGARALRAYVRFFGECLTVAEQDTSLPPTMLRSHVEARASH